MTSGFDEVLDHPFEPQTAALLARCEIVPAANEALLVDDARKSAGLSLTWPMLELHAIPAPVTHRKIAEIRAGGRHPVERYQILVMPEDVPMLIAALQQVAADPQYGSRAYGDE